MLNKVREMRPSYNNASGIAGSVTVSSLKLLYYQAFARVYSWVGRHAQVVMVNSSWTQQHVATLWWYGNGANDNSRRSTTQSAVSTSSGASNFGSENDTRRRSLALVYPPCNTSELLAMPLASSSASPTQPTEDGKKRIILSIAQFRPEKDHMLQIRYVLFTASTFLAANVQGLTFFPECYNLTGP